MEMLATLVLNGEGSRLIGRNSRNSELQSFLDNVPTYMQKINKVHVAAREGNIRDLQAALDRRKFAIARDSISPNGATPLHVATIFGKTNIIKYLGGRFPETLSAVDFEGRTALHYAAVLPDNGHYYNLLQQLGANSKDLDDNGKSAEEYQKNPNLLPFDQLLSDYGISEDAAQSMFSDKVPEDQVSSRRVLDAPDALDTLDRCYELLASARPVRTPLSASSNRATPPLVLARFLKKPIFDVIKYRITKLDHDLFDVIWPAVKKLPDNRNILQTVEEDFPGGITAPDYYVYDVFNEFLVPLIKDLHNINVNSDLPTHPRSDFITTSSAKLSSEPLVELNIDPNEEFVLSGVIECSRNLEGFELPLNLKVGKLETIERIVTTLLMKEDFSKFSEPNPESDQKGGTYYTMNEVLEKPSEICAALASNGLLIALCDRDEIDDSARLHGKHWPYGRGVFVTDDRNVAVWINVHDHIRVLVSSAQDSPGEIGLAFSKISYIMSYLHEKLDFTWDAKLGEPNPESDQKGGTYYTMNEVLEKPSEICAALASNGLLIALCDRDEIDDSARLHGKHWPYGRGVFVTDDRNVAVWINVHDHIRVLVSSAQDSPGEIGLAFSKISYIMSYLHEKLDFTWDAKLGYLSARPTFLGAGIRFSLIVNFPGLSKDPDNMKHLCAMRGLQYRETLSTDIARISNYQSLSTSHADNGHMDIPIFRTEEGRYLAQSLGDPLIKGLTEVANIKPKDPVAFLASFLHNFPEQEKSNLGTQETEMLVTREAAEVENEQPPRPAVEPAQANAALALRTRTATKHQRPIDIVTVEPQPVTSPDAPESAFSSATRDEHGQSMLHFAAARTHARNALFQLLQESDISLGYRDELYRTARDVSIQANVPENTVEIDKWMLHLAARGNTDKIMELLMEGYDHILDVVDEEGVPITEVIAQRGDTDMSNLLASIPAFEESREALHGAVRRGDLSAVQASLAGEGARTLARCQNSFGRTALHVAVLAQHEDVVAYLAQTYPELLRLGDNLERTPLHYAMGVEKIESLSRVLIRAGAKRVLKDLKGRQPTYYFMNKSEILRLKEEEDVY
uniref:Arginine kinase n=1 Tax=Heliothis virescens TaxID=7102 RepID=A0A2A4IUQ4_HELVI